MIRKEVALRLMSVGYIQSMLGSSDTFWYHRDNKFVVQIHYGGHVTIWYKQHPVRWCWDGEARRFYNRDIETDVIDEVIRENPFK